MSKEISPNGILPDGILPNGTMLRVKDADLETVVSFLRTHLLNGSEAHPTHACVLMLLPLQPAAPPPIPAKGLTQHEFDVLKGVAEGHSNAQIACELATTVGSIKGTIQSLFRKLEVHAKRRSALVRAAVDHAPLRLESDLTPVEASVRELIGQCSNREIAERLQIPEIAVKAAIRGICAKAGVRNRKQLVRTAHSGLV